MCISGIHGFLILYFENQIQSDKNFRIDIENQEHALFLKLVGVPDEFKKYIEISKNQHVIG